MSASPDEPGDRIELPVRLGDEKEGLPGPRLGIDIAWFREADGWVAGRFTPTEALCGWEGVIHGGVTAYVIDEALAYVATAARGQVGMTLRLDVHYGRPLFTGVEYTVRGRITDRREGHAVVIEVRIEDTQGACVTGYGTYRLAEARLLRRLLQHMRRSADAAGRLTGPPGGPINSGLEKP